MGGFAPLTGVRRADAAIVGGGWTGLLTALFLAERGMDVLLVTAGSIGGHQPVLTASLHQPELYRRVLAFHGIQTLRGQLSARRRLMEQLPDWLEPLSPYREAEMYAYARLPGELPDLEAQLRLLSDLGVPCEAAPDAGGCPFPVERSTRWQGLLIDAEQLADALASRILAAGGRICCRSPVLNASAGQVFTADGRVDAALVLLCTGKPLGLRSRRLLALLESRTCLRCRLQSPFPLHSLQEAITPGGLTLIPAPGGAEVLWDAGRTGTREELQRTALLHRLLRQRLPEWAQEPLRFGQLVRPMDGLPVVGSLRAHRGRILCAAGVEDFPGALLAAQALSRLALRCPRPEDLLLRPDRPLPRRALQLLRLRLRRHRAVNALRRSAPRCSHCACRLRYLPDARWWGCPCCGSAFGLLGRRRSGPALMDAEISATQRPGW